MQDGKSYTLEVSLVNQPEYTISTTVTPQPEGVNRSFLKAIEDPSAKDKGLLPF